MKKSLLMLSVALAGLTAAAATQTKPIVDFQSTRGIATRISAPVAKTDSINVTVAFDPVDADGNGADGACTPQSTMLVYGFDGYYDVDYTAGQNTTVRVPAGTYDLATKMVFNNAMRVTKKASEAFVVKEKLNLTTDTTFTLSLKDAKHLITCNYVLPNGEKYHNTTTETTNGQVIEAQNATSTGRIMLVHKNFGALMVEDNQNFGVTEVTNGVLSRYGGVDVFTSDLSSDYILLESGWFLMSDDATSTPITILQGTVGCNKSLTLENANKYIDITDHYRITPAGYKLSTLQGGGGQSMQIANRGSDLVLLGGAGSTSRASRTDTVEVADRTIHVCDQLSGQAGAFIKDGVYTNVIDYGYMTKYHFPERFFSQSPNYIIENGKVLAALNGVSTLSNGIVDGVKQQVITGHPEFSYYKDQMGEDQLCNNVPVLSASTSINSSDKTAKYLYANYIGRYGETRQSDANVADVVVTSGDQTVYQGKLSSVFSQAFMRLKSAGLGTAKATIAIADSNIVVDDMQGVNLTTLNIDLGAKDFSAPSVQMLQLRNTATGKVTDRFAENTTDAELRLAAGDFTNDPESGLYTYGTSTVKVSYSPSGKDDWKPFTVAQEPANKREVAFGDFYRGTLEQIQVPSDNKWYDLKIVVTDPTGNSQEQVLKPAFRIEKIESTGVADVNEAKAVQSVRYYDLTGRQSAEPTTGISIKVTTYTDGTSRTLKVISKK